MFSPQTKKRFIYQQETKKTKTITKDSIYDTSRVVSKLTDIQ